MFRWLMFMSLRLLIICAGIGLLICKQWGWPEYASPELYLIYRVQQNVYPGDKFSHFLINADGRSQEKLLSWKNGKIITLDCSPDGRTVGFLTDVFDLYVVSKTGLVYERNLSQIYPQVEHPQPQISVTNGGLVALYFPNSDGLIVDSHSARFVPPPDSNPYFYFTTSDSGLLVWYFYFKSHPGVKVFSPSNELIWDLQDSTFSGWLPSEKDFIYATKVYSQHFADLATQITVNRGYYLGVLSPDGTKFAQELGPGDPIGISDYLKRYPVVELPISTDDANPHSPIPLCFLTFRPQMLIGGG